MSTPDSVADHRNTVSDAILAAMRETNVIFDKQVIQPANCDALDRVYTAQARILPPGAPMIVGREAIKGFWKQAIAGLGLKSVKLSTVEAEMAGDSVVEIGSADLKVGDGSIVTIKYVVQWKQEDGAWKWNVDIWNPNQ
jgi:ketosteroid isomerase-like protein